MRNWALIAMVAATAACASERLPPGRLRARPGEATGDCSAGLHELHIATKRDTLLFVPAHAKTPAPLLLFLHGATQNGERFIARLQEFAEKAGVIVLAPTSRDITWDGIRGSLGTDVKLIDRALADVFSRCSVDPKRIAIGGFSDGASYALSLGLANGDLFHRVVAFSPCIISDEIEPRGKPEIFISHGRWDHILPIDACGQRIVLELRDATYDVQFEEFDGDHEVPAPIARAAFTWVAQ